MGTNEVEALRSLFTERFRDLKESVDGIMEVLSAQSKDRLEMERRITRIETRLAIWRWALGLLLPAAAGGGILLGG